MAARKQRILEQKRSRAGRGALLALLGISAAALALLSFIPHPSAFLWAADYPAWWTNRAVVVVSGGAVTNDFAAVNAGQVKWLATKAWEELEAHLPGGAGASVQAIVQGFSTTNNHAGVNIGQLKCLASPFYDRLIAEGYTNAYPWTTNTADDVNYAAANIGQVKQLFSFDLTLDEDDDGAPNWIERLAGTDPLDPDSDNDTMLDGYEIAHLGGLLFHDPATNAARLNLWTTNSGNWGVHTEGMVRYLVGGDVNAATASRTLTPTPQDFSVETVYILRPLDAYTHSPATMELRFGSGYACRLEFGSAGSQVAVTAGLRLNGAVLSGSASYFTSKFWTGGGANFGLRVMQFDGKLGYTVDYTKTDETAGQVNVTDISSSATAGSVELYQAAGNPSRLKQGFGAVLVERPGLDPLNAGDADGDLDGDGVTNKTEAAAGTSVLRADSDGDGFPDGWELQHFGAAAATNANLPGASNDPDGDGRTNLQEYQGGTGPNTWDSDGDLISDGEEVAANLNPLNASDGTQDADSDGISNREEALYGGLIRNANTDGDAHGNDGAERTAGTYVNSPEDPDGPPISVSFMVADHVDREGDRPSQRYRVNIWDNDTPSHIILRHQPMESFAGTTNETRAYNQFRAWWWYSCRVEPIARISATNAPDCDYTFEIQGSTPGYYLETSGAIELADSYEDRETNWFERILHFRMVPGEVDLDGQEASGGGGWSDIVDDDELQPGVKVTNGVARLLVQDPKITAGHFLLQWSNPDGQWMTVDGSNSPVRVECTGPWPKTLEVVCSTNWSTAVVEMTHSLSPGNDAVRLGRIPKVRIEPAGRIGIMGGANVWFSLSSDSTRPCTWQIEPDLGSNGAWFAGGPSGEGTNWYCLGTGAWVNVGNFASNYTITARFFDGVEESVDAAGLVACREPNWTPVGGSIYVYSPISEEAINFSGAFVDELTRLYQGWTVSSNTWFKDPFTNDNDCGTCTLENLKSMTNGGIVVLMTHGFPGMVEVARFTNEAAALAWKGEEPHMTIISTQGVSSVIASYGWFQQHWKPAMDARRGLVFLSTCSGASGGNSMAVNVGGETVFALSGPQIGAEVEMHFSTLVQQMNGTRTFWNPSVRPAKRAYESLRATGSIPSFVILEGSGRTTLCPVPQTVFPSASVGADCRWGCIALDTYMDNTVSADSAVLPLEGVTGSRQWVGDGLGRYAVEFGYQGSGLIMKAVGSNCVSESSGGMGRFMDGDGIAPCDQEEGDAKTWNW